MAKNACPPMKIKDELLNYIKFTYQDEEECKFLLQNLALPPVFSTLRINLLISKKEDIITKLSNALSEQYESRGLVSPSIEEHEMIADALVVPHSGPHLDLPHLNSKVIVGIACGMAVLRGANVYAQGIVGAPSYLQAGQNVSVYADVNGECLKGLVKPFGGETIFVGNGIMTISRKDLFASEKQASGVAIQMTNPLYVAPSLSGILPSLIFPQNFPSILCSHILNPCSGEHVIDMCAAPGGKTVHLATLMQNQGRVVAFDKAQGKVDKIRSNASDWGISCIDAYVYDASKSCSLDAVAGGPPPYPPASFDHVLLDAPCSALGQRPSAANRMREKEVKSYPILQRKIFDQAVNLLKEGGSLVYSTCTITAEENEKQVAWALKKFPHLQLSSQSPHFGGIGRPHHGLDDHQIKLVQRFDPVTPSSDVSRDTIGFFIAKFIKNSG